jgi:hypothetical protein
MQLKLFDDVTLREVELIAPDSPKKAFWRLKLIYRQVAYRIDKESGGGGKVLDRRSWPQRDRERAERVFARKVAEKLKPGRKRIYKKKTKNDR